MENGTERLRLQFRDAAQRGQQDRYGGDQVEDAAAGSARQIERGVENLLKGRRKMGSSQKPVQTPPEYSGSPERPEEHPRTGPENQPAGRQQIKTRETDGRGASRGGGTPDSVQGRPTAPQAGHEVIKTKDAYMERQVPAVQTSVQNRDELVQKQGRSLAIRRTEQRRGMKSGGPTPTGGQGRRGASLFGQAHPLGAKSSINLSPGQAFKEKSLPGRAGIKVRPGHGTPGKAPARATRSAKRIPGRTVKTVQQTTETARQLGSSVCTMQAAAHSAQRTTQVTRLTAESAAVTARSAARAVSAAVKGAVAAAHSLAVTIAAGGWVVIVIVLVICLVGMLIASPFGIFFANDSNSPDAVSPSAAVAQLNGELAERLAQLQEDGTYDQVEIQGQPPSWSDVLAVFAAKTAGAEDGVDVAVLDPQRVELLRTVFWDMTKITTVTETVEIPASEGTPDSTKEVLTITITARTPDDMRVFYSFTAWQNEALDELLTSSDLLMALAGDLTISSQDAKKLLANLPADLSPERRAVVETACQLVGKVNYFWGGKSLVLGWDDRWGTLRQVTAAGSSTTGTYRPYGMDCSGYVDWVFYNVTGGEYIIGHGGGAHAQHTYCVPISWDQAMPGDLVFYPDDEHVGIVGGRDESGDVLIIHCAYGANNVVITGADGFTSIGRPVFYSE